MRIATDIGVMATNLKVDGGIPAGDAVESTHRKVAEAYLRLAQTSMKKLGEYKAGKEGLT